MNKKNLFYKYDHYYSKIVKPFIETFKNFFQPLNIKETKTGYGISRLTVIIKETDLEKLSSIIEDYYDELKIKYLTETDIKKQILNDVEIINKNVKNNQLLNLSCNMSALSSNTHSKIACPVLILNYEKWKYKEYFTLNHKEFNGHMTWIISPTRSINLSKLSSSYEKQVVYYRFIAIQSSEKYFTDSPKKALEKYIQDPRFKKILIKDFGEIF